MGWTGEQQIRLLLRCMGLGVLLGVLFDVCSVIGAASRRRWGVILWDALFGVLAALLTFYVSLAIMDGRMHPLLFAGSAIGFVTQHETLGRPGVRLMRRVAALIGRTKRFAAGKIRRFSAAVFRFFGQLDIRKALQSRKIEKISKKD